jgi:hypothetical protein
VFEKVAKRRGEVSRQLTFGTLRLSPASLLHGTNPASMSDMAICHRFRLAKFDCLGKSLVVSENPVFVEELQNSLNLWSTRVNFRRRLLPHSLDPPI